MELNMDEIMSFIENMKESDCVGDVLVSGVAADGYLRVVGAQTKDLVEKCRKTHNMSATATAALGRLLIGAVLMSKEMKNDSDKLTIQIKGKGKIGGMAAVVRIATKDGAAGALDSVCVKGYAENPMADLPTRESDGKLDVGGIVGQGFMNVIMDLGLKEPYSGSVPLHSGEIAEDLSYYYLMSKQVPTAISLGVLIGENLEVLQAGGYMVQLLPGAPDKLIDDIERNISYLPSVTTLLNAGASIINILQDVTRGYDLNISEKVTCEYKCDCSKERMEEAICSIGKDELKTIIDEDHGAELCCHFCNNKYSFDEAELQKLYDNM